jgi:YHS domain-containing protein
MPDSNKPQWVLAVAGWILALGLLFLVWRAFERLGAGSQNAGAPAAAADTSGLATDPVSNEHVTRGEPNFRALYQNHEYWFASKRDKMAFLTDPERYLGGKSIFASLSPTAAAATPAPATAVLTAVPTAVPTAAPVAKPTAEPAATPVALFNVPLKSSPAAKVVTPAGAVMK